MSYEQENNSESSAERVSVSEFRDNMADLMKRVEYGGKRFRIYRHGKDRIALVSLEDLNLLEALEDQVDAQLARDALNDPENQGASIPFSQIEAELGLDQGDPCF
jgi:prevent-host-death family protein